MIKLKLSKKAQSTLEYAVLIGVLVAALVAMQTYLKRGYQGKLREGADQMGEQFSPGHTTYTYTTTSDTVSGEDVQSTQGNAQTLTTITSQTSDKTGSETVAVGAQENWW